jgi:hypothetical protein
MSKQCGRMVLTVGQKMTVQWQGEKEPANVRTMHWLQCGETENLEEWQDESNYTHLTCVKHNKLDWNVKPKESK